MSPPKISHAEVGLVGEIKVRTFRILKICSFKSCRNVFLFSRNSDLRNSSVSLSVCLFVKFNSISPLQLSLQSLSISSSLNCSLQFSPAILLDYVRPSCIALVSQLLTQVLSLSSLLLVFSKSIATVSHFRLVCRHRIVNYPQRLNKVISQDKIQKI